MAMALVETLDRSMSSRNQYGLKMEDSLGSLENNLSADGPTSQIGHQVEVTRNWWPFQQNVSVASGIECSDGNGRNLPSSPTYATYGSAFNSPNIWAPEASSVANQRWPTINQGPGGSNNPYDMKSHNTPTSSVSQTSTADADARALSPPLGPFMLTENLSLTKDLGINTSSPDSVAFTESADMANHKILEQKAFRSTTLDASIQKAYKEFSPRLTNIPTGPPQPNRKIVADLYDDVLDCIDCLKIETTPSSQHPQCAVEHLENVFTSAEYLPDVSRSYFLLNDCVSELVCMDAELRKYEDYFGIRSMKHTITAAVPYNTKGLSFMLRESYRQYEFFVKFTVNIDTIAQGCSLSEWNFTNFGGENALSNQNNQINCYGKIIICKWNSSLAELRTKVEQAVVRNAIELEDDTPALLALHKQILRGARFHLGKLFNTALAGKNQTQNQFSTYQGILPRRDTNNSPAGDIQSFSGRDAPFFSRRDVQIFSGRDAQIFPGRDTQSFPASLGYFGLPRGNNRYRRKGKYRFSF